MKGEKVVRNIAVGLGVIGCILLIIAFIVVPYIGGQPEGFINLENVTCVCSSEGIFKLCRLDYQYLEGRLERDSFVVATGLSEENCKEAEE